MMKTLNMTKVFIVRCAGFKMSGSRNYIYIYMEGQSGQKGHLLILINDLLILINDLLILINGMIY